MKIPLVNRLSARFVACTLLLCAGFLLFRARGDGQPASQDGAITWADFSKTVQPFLAKHCQSCHGADKQSSDVRLDGFRDEKALKNDLALLERAASMLRKRAMPPKKQPQPSEEEVRTVVDWVDRYLDQMDSQANPNSGPVMFRRLNRTEYNNTVRDLFGVTIRPADDFPADNSAHGFDTVSDALTISPALMERYLDAAEKVARTALFGSEPLKVSSFTHQPWYIDFSTSKAVKTEYDETGMSLPGAVHVIHRFPVEGEYALRGILRGFRPNGSDPVEVGFWIDGKLVKEMKVAVPKGGELNGLWTEFRTTVTEGDHWLSITYLRMYEGLPPAYKGPNPAKTTAGIGQASDGYFLSNAVVTGPFSQVKGPSTESIKKIFIKGIPQEPHDQAQTRAILANMAHRAYRRPVTDKELEELVKIVDMVQKDGDTYEEGLCLAFQKVLISPHFLFRVEKSRPPGAEPSSWSLSDHGLAARLSFFLWSSMPDDELSQCADAGQLRDPKVLETQVRRILNDPKANALAENFGGQWLQFRALESHIPDRKKFQQYTDYTRMSMQQETQLFFEHIVREDRSVLDFIDGHYTFLNQRLAEFYKIPGVKGHEFRKVDLTGTPRGGVWTQGSVLTVSSYAHRTSPVLRGKWILENILNAPPPPPPADVPILNEETVGKASSLREQLEKHRENAACATCHARMDPLGFGLENFDPIGAWREKDGKFAVDASGTLPDGTSFVGPVELRKILRADANAFAEGLAEKMLTYALGRGMERRDRKTIMGIVQRMTGDDYRFSSLVLGIVESPQFKSKK